MTLLSHRPWVVALPLPTDSPLILKWYLPAATNYMKETLGPDPAINSCFHIYLGNIISQCQLHYQGVVFQHYQYVLYVLICKKGFSCLHSTVH